MSERIHKISLLVDIPGPKAMDEPLETVEKTFLEKFRPGLVKEIEEGRVWQNR